MNKKIIKICKISDSAINLRILIKNSDGTQKPRFLTWRSLFGDFSHSKFLGSQKATPFIPIFNLRILDKNSDDTQEPLHGS